MAADRAASPSAATSTQPASATDRERWRGGGAGTGRGGGRGKGICMPEQAASEMGNAIAIDDGGDGGGLSQC